MKGHGKQKDFRIKANGKVFSVSRDLYHALEAESNRVKSHAEGSTEDLKKIAHEMQNILFEGISDHMTIKVAFTAEGAMRHNTLQRTVHTTGLSQDELLSEFMKCCNDALFKRNDTLAKKSQAKIKQNAARLESAA